MNQQTYYALASKKTGKLLRIEEEPNNSTYACGATRVTFSTDENYPEFLVEERLTAERARVFDTGWYNSGTECPGHGYIDLSEYSVVRVTKTVHIQELTQLPNIKTFGKELKGVGSHPTDKNLTLALLLGSSEVKEGELFWMGSRDNPVEVIKLEIVENQLTAILKPWSIDSYLIDYEKEA